MHAEKIEVGLITLPNGFQVQSLKSDGRMPVQWENQKNYLSQVLSRLSITIEECYILFAPKGAVGAMRSSDLKLAAWSEEFGDGAITKAFAFFGEIRGEMPLYCRVSSFRKLVSSETVYHVKDGVVSVC